MSLEREETPATGDDDADDVLFDDAEDEGDDADKGDGEENEEGEDDDEGESGEEDRRRASKADERIEALAREAGWKPKDKWKGDGWVPAEQFLKNAAKRANNAKREVRDLTERMSALEGAHKDAMKRQAEALTAKAKQLKAEAIKKEKDPDKAAKLVEEIDEVLAEEQAKLAEKAEAPREMKLTALDKKFFAENAWLIDEHDSEEDEAEADEAFDMLQAEMQRLAKAGVSAVRAYKEAKELLREAYPHRYEDDEDDDDEPARKRGAGKKPARRSPDLAGGRRQMNGDERGGGDLYSKLPPEAKRAAKECLDRKIYGSLEEYAEVYFDEKRKERRA